MHSLYAPIKKDGGICCNTTTQLCLYYDTKDFFDSVKLYNSITLKTNTLYKKHCFYFTSLKNNRVYNQILFFISRVFYFYFL